jgi:hypothetical protein
MSLPRCCWSQCRANVELSLPHLMFFALYVSLLEVSCSTSSSAFLLVMLSCPCLLVFGCHCLFLLRWPKCRAVFASLPHLCAIVNALCSITKFSFELRAHMINSFELRPHMIISFELRAHMMISFELRADMMISFACS